MKKSILLKQTSFILLLMLALSHFSLAQISNKQGISSISIHPSATLFTLGLPQNTSISNGFQKGAFSYNVFPFTALPINTSVNRDGKTELYGLIGSFDLGITYSKLLRNNRIFKTEIGAYYTSSPNSYAIKDEYHYFVNGKESSIWQNTLEYSGFSASVTYTSKSRGRRGLGEVRNYVEVGARTMNFLNQSAKENEDWIANGQGFRIESKVVNRTSTMLFFEIGKTFWRPANDMRSLNMGIRVGIPLSHFVENTYSGIVNNQVIASTSALENGAYIGFQVSYHLPIKTVTKSYLERKAEKIYCEMERKVKIKHYFKVKEEELLIEIFDHENEDGDIISLCFNGQYILEKHLLTRKPKVLTLKLRANQKNILTVFANNTGKEGANTSAIRFSVNGKKEEIILYADKKESEGISFEN